MRNRKWTKAALVSLGVLICVGFLASCGVTIRPTVATGYDWAGTNKILVIGVSELKQSPEISRTLTHKLFEGGYPVVRRDAYSVLDIYDIGREEGAEVVAYGELSKVEIYYPHHHGEHHSTYPIKTVEVELRFIETETRRTIWKGAGSLEDSASIADEFLVDKLLAEMVEDIVPQWTEIPRSVTDIPMLKLGENAPLFEVQDVNGKSYALTDDLGDKVIVLNFWSLFCEHCKQQIRLLDEVQRRYGNKGVRIIAVSVEGEPLADRIASYVDESGFDLTFLMDKHSDEFHEIADSYRVPGTPALYVIGKSGKIVFARSGHLTTGELSEVIESELRKG